MPRFEPFFGLRYDPSAAPLAEVIAPPYDVVDDSERARLAARSPYNSILVELPVADEAAGLDRYANAAALLGAWQRSGVLRRDDVASFYVYKMSFATEDGTPRSTTGVIGALAIDAAGGKEVLPHEQTMPKPKGDRLDLLRACAANLSPIWGLSLAPGLTDACLAAVGDAPAPMSATDDDQILHECWPVDHPVALGRISELVATTPVVIADGHHRYETATFYRNERRATNAERPGPYDAVMAYVVELTEHELTVQAIHRLVSGLPEDVDVLEHFAAHFAIEPGPGDELALHKAMGTANALGFVSGEGNHLLVPNEELLARAEADLDSSRLDVALSELPAHEVVYQHGVRNAVQAVREGRAQFAVLLRPATVAQIADTAHSGRRMPPKTTFFHPKPRTGIVYRSVAG